MKKSVATEQARARIFEILGHLTQAMASPARLRILQVLSNRPSTVEILSQRSQESVANTSQHLQKLSKAGLVSCEKQGVSRVYRLANEKVVDTWLSLQTLAMAVSPSIGNEIAVVCPTELVSDSSPAEIRKLVKANEALLIDLREQIEFDTTPAPYAIHIPIENLEESLKQLPKSKTIFVFCRGNYCAMANPAVEMLRKKGYRAFRLRETSYELRG